jgi:acyl-CoA thioesterase FadM
MARIKIDLPSQLSFSTTIPVRITDLNYGGHVGNDKILSIMHEARLQFLSHHGFTEMEAGGAGLIMSDAAIEYKSELFYGDVIIANVAAGDFSKIGFDLYYKFEKKDGDKTRTVAIGKTGMICYSYPLKKVVSLPEVLKSAIS